MSTVPSGKKRNIDLHIFPKERTPLHSRFNEKEWKSPKRNLHSFFILFCCKFFIFRYFHKFMFRYHSKKYRPVSTHKKHPFRDASQAWHMAAVLFFCRIFTAVGYRFGKRFPRERLDFSVRVSQSDGCHHFPFHIQPFFSSS